MYSLVLMAALTGGTNAPAFHHHGWSCCGCHGSSYGCWGGCYGCWGGSYGGWGCCGCYGGGWGCYGACYGGCYGGYGAWYGCYGGCYGGGYGCYGYYGVGAYAPVIAPAVETPVAPPRDQDRDRDRPAPRDRSGDRGGGSVSLDRGKLVVQLPADAKLYIDDHLMKTGSERRTFSTPVLERGQLYYYEVRAEISSSGKPYSETKRVIVKAGEKAEVSFRGMEARAPYKSNAVAGR